MIDGQNESVAGNCQDQNRDDSGNARYRLVVYGTLAPGRPNHSQLEALDGRWSPGKLRGRLHKYKGTPVVCTYHPAALLRNEAWKKDTWEDMKMLLRTMGRPIPGAKS